MQLRTEIEIDAPPERVWSVLTDFSGYHTWNPLITSIQGELAVGKTLTVAMTPPEMSETTLKPTILVCDAPRELRWRGQLWFKGLFDGEHFFKVEGRPGGSRFVHGEDFSGLLVRFANRQLTQVARGFVYMNQALKKHLEETPQG
jgi:hypothetical protein